MKVTVYTIKDCAFSKQEKEYLNTHKLQYEEKDLETNKDFLTEMLAVSNNFAGTPVTRVEKDDGTIAVLKGFTKEEFDTTFGFAAAPTKIESENPTPTDVLANSTVSPVPIPVETPVATTPDLSTDLSSKVSTTEEASAKVDPLKSVMDNLQSQSTTPAPEIPVVPPAPLSPVINEPIPPITDKPITDSTVPPADAPAIPDFPAK